MDDIKADPLLDKFVEELSDEHGSSLQEFSWFIGNHFNESTHVSIKSWHESVPVPIVYLFQAAILRVFEVGMTLTASLASENVAAASIVKKHIKEKISRW